MIFRTDSLCVMVLVGSLLSNTLFVSSCSKGPAEPAFSDSQVQEVVFAITGAKAVKSEAEGAEAQYSDIVAMIFTLEGEVESAKSFSSEDKVSLEVRKGFDYNYYIVANAPDTLVSVLDDITESAFLRLSCTLEDMAADGFTMYASGLLQTESMGKEPVSVELRRYCSKVFVGSIEVPFVSTLSVVPEVRLGRIVLINAVGEVPFSAVPTASGVWFNRMGVDESFPKGVESFLLRDYGGKAAVSQEGVPVLDATCALYAMPNPVGEASSDESWSPRCTRVAVEVFFDGVPYWYPVSLPAMECNKAYIIDPLVLIGPGSYSPDVPVGRDGMDFRVEVLDWTEADKFVDFMSED